MVSLISKLLIIAILLNLSACGKNMQSQIKAPINSFSQPSMSNVLQEIGINNDATNISSGISLVFFSSYTCGSCKKEQKHIKEYIKDKDLLVDIYTVLISIDDNNAAAKNNFQGSVGFNWPIHTDPSLKAFKTLCRGDQTPCTIGINKQNEILMSHTGVLEISEIEKRIKTKIAKKSSRAGGGGIGTNLPPIGGNQPPPTTPPAGGPKLEFIEDLLVNVTEPQAEIRQMEFDTSVATRPLVVLFSSFMCSSCIQENKELAALVAANDPRFKDVDIITSYFFPMSDDPNSDAGKKAVQDFRDETKVKWPVFLDKMDMMTMGIKLFSKYVQDPMGFQVPPGTAVFLPGKGRVFHKEGAHISDIEAALKL